MVTINISYGDASVLEGEVIFQDVDADLAFVLPDQEFAKKLNKKFTPVDLSQFAEEIDYADRVVGLSRTSSAFSFMPTLVMGRITGVFEGRKHTYFVNSAGSTNGMPIFTTDGRPVGLTVQRVLNGQPTDIFATISAKSIQALAKQANGG